MQPDAQGQLMVHPQAARQQLLQRQAQHVMLVPEHVHGLFASHLPFLSSKTPILIHCLYFFPQYRSGWTLGPL
jgi:hypothetical protein